LTWAYNTQPLTYTQLILRRFLRHRLAVLGGVVLIGLVLSAVFAPLISPYPVDEQDLFNLTQAPSPQHWLGTDDLGRDLLTRLLHGGRISLLVGIASSVISTFIGTLVGALAGFYGGTLDNVLMRLVDVLLAFPSVFLLLILFSAIGTSLWLVIAFLGAFGWLYLARVIRGEMLSLREKNFVEAARAQGVSNARLITRHLLPNVTGVLIVNTTLQIAYNLLAEGTLSFLGFGVPASTPTWGNILYAAANYARSAPWYVLFPGALLTLSILAVNFFGDGLRDALDPRS
jgi:peptide/nickel transport system permease protein